MLGRVEGAGRQRSKIRFRSRLRLYEGFSFMDHSAPQPEPWPSHKSDMSAQLVIVESGTPAATQPWMVPFHVIDHGRHFLTTGGRCHGMTRGLSVQRRGLT